MRCAAAPVTVVPHIHTQKFTFCANTSPNKTVSLLLAVLLLSVRLATDEEDTAIVGVRAMYSADGHHNHLGYE